MLIFVFVKRMAIFVIAFLSLFLSGREGFSQADSQNISDSITKDSPADFGREMSFISVCGEAFSGNPTSFSGSIRLTQTGRRINPSTKTTFRLIRSGKVIDTHNFDPFLSALFPKVCGIRSFFRFIYAICCLRL